MEDISYIEDDKNTNNKEELNFDLDLIDNWFEANEELLKNQEENYVEELNEINSLIPSNEDNLADESIRTISTYFTYKHKNPRCYDNTSTDNTQVVNEDGLNSEINNTSIINNSVIFQIENKKETKIHDPIYLSNLKESLFVEEIIRLYTNELKNKFDISFYLFQSLLLKQQNNSNENNILSQKEIFMSIIRCSLIKTSMVKEPNKLNESNLRKRAKTFFNKILVKFLNFFITFLFEDKLPLLSNLNFTDPHRKNNFMKIKQTVVNLISEDRVDNKYLKIAIDRIIKGEIKIQRLNNPIGKIMFQLLYSILNMPYSEAFELFFESKIYENIFFKNISQLYGKNYAVEFNYYAASFISYVQDAI